MSENDFCSNCGYSKANDAERLPILTSDSVRSYLKNNEPPLDIEASPIRATRTDAQGNLDELERRITVVKDALLTLEMERDHMAKIVHEHKVVLSPLRRLSTEILSEIFLAAEPEITLDTTRGSWLTAQVSERWRSIAVSMPRLWSTISIALNAKNETFPQRSLSILHTLLCRAGYSPLDIVFDFDGDRHRPGNQTMEVKPLLELLVAVCHRWRTFEIRCSIRFFDHLAPVEGNLPHLTHLSIGVVDYRDTSFGGLPMVNLNMFSQAPRLHTVVLERSRKLDMEIPWSQITTFKNDHGPSGIYSTNNSNGIYSTNNLTKLVNVRHLEIRGADEHTPEPTGSLIRLEHLHYLDIVGGSKVLDHLTLPVLDGLHFQGLFTSTVMWRMTRLLNRSSCRMTRLKLSVMCFSAIPVELFQALGPSLVEFEYLLTSSAELGEGQSIMNLLSLEQSHASFIFPRLSVLKVDISQYRVSFDPVSFSNAMKSRTTFPVSCLRTLHFRYHPTADPLTLENIENLPLLWNA